MSRYGTLATILNYMLITCMLIALGDNVFWSDGPWSARYILSCVAFVVAVLWLALSLLQLTIGWPEPDKRLVDTRTFQDFMVKK